MMEILSEVFTPSLIYATLRSATPLIYAGLCAAITQQAGILNLGTEGIMLMGAFVAVAVGYFTGSWIIAVMAAMVSGVIIALIIAVGSIRYKAQMPAISTGMNLMVIAVTRYLLSTMFNVSGTFMDPGIPGISKVHFSFLENIPLLNTIFNDWVFTEWFVFVVIAITYIYIFKTSSGLRLRAVGKFERAAETAGINTTKIKYLALIFSGLLGGLAGAHLSLGYSNMFVHNMTNNRGYMGISAMWFGGAHPVFTAVGALIFGFFESIGARLQPWGFPSQFVLAMPYIVTIVVLSIVLYKNKVKYKQRKSSLVKDPELKDVSA